MTARQNIERLLCHFGLDNSIEITAEEPDRIFGWPWDDRLMRLVVLNEWQQDVRRVSEHYHGSRISYREKGVRPALQVVFHESRDALRGYFVELDLDEYAPSGPWGFIAHAAEVARNAVTGRKTDQERIAELLDRRLGGAVPE